MYFDRGLIGISDQPVKHDMPIDQMVAYVLTQRREFKRERMMKMSIDTFTIFWDDLTPDCQKRLEKFLGDNGNYDVFPITTITKEGKEI